MKNSWQHLSLIFLISLLSISAMSATGPKIDVKGQIELGKISSGSIKEKTIPIKNKGDKELFIKDFYASCGCTSVNITSQHIAPNGKTNLKIKYNTKGMKSGKDNKSIYIISNDPVSPKLEIKLTAEIINSKIIENKEKISNIPKISSEELYQLLEDGEVITILDVREENEYIERHIPNAILFSKSKFDKNNQEILTKLKQVDKSKPVVSYCGAGHRSSYVTKKLKEKGYDAYNLDGISFWEEKGYPLIRGPKLPASQEPAIVHLEEAYQHYFLLFEDIVWIDVRNKKDYQKGHIKGALGIPLSDLENNLARIPKDKEIVFYCEGAWDGGRCDASISGGRILIENGFDQGKIKVFEDGYGAWENAGYPIEKGGRYE